MFQSIEVTKKSFIGQMEIQKLQNSLEKIKKIEKIKNKQIYYLLLANIYQFLQKNNINFTYNEIKRLSPINSPITSYRNLAPPP